MKKKSVKSLILLWPAKDRMKFQLMTPSSIIACRNIFCIRHWFFKREKSWERIFGEEREGVSYETWISVQYSVCFQNASSIFMTFFILRSILMSFLLTQKILEHHNDRTIMFKPLLCCCCCHIISVSVHTCKIKQIIWQSKSSFY